MDLGTLSGIVTLVLIITFIGVVIWAYSSKRRRDFDEAARLPFEDGHTGSSRGRDQDHE